MQDWGNRVEAARLGYIFARSRKAHARWRRQHDRIVTDKPAPMSEASLMQALSRAAAMFPNNVIHGVR